MEDTEGADYSVFSVSSVDNRKVIMLTQPSLLAHLRALGITSGDLLLVHSALRRLGPVEGGADGVIDALVAAVGPEGTVAVPTHTWGTVSTQQPVFHQTLSPSIVGTLTNVFRMRPEARRSLHPTHSVAAIGARAAELIEGHERDDTPCSATSPYGKLIAWQGKILFIGAGLECCTFFHCCEELADTPWLFGHTEQHYSIPAAGAVIPVFSRRHNHGCSDLYPLLEPPLREAGILTSVTVGDCMLRLLDASRAAAWLIPQLREDPELIRRHR